MTEVIITVQRFDQLKQFPLLFETRFGDAMTVATAKLLGDAIARSPVDRGFFRSSLDSEVIKKSPVEIIGRVSASATHAQVIEGVDEQGNPVEFGRRPGTRFPPVIVLRAWVERKLGITGPEAARVAFLIGRAIVRRGIAPKRPLSGAFEANRNDIQKLFDDAAERLAKDVEGGTG